MKKQLLAIFITVLTIFSITGCSNDKSITVNVKNVDSLDNTVFGNSALVEIGNGLWYDTSTRIVYWWNKIYLTGGNQYVTTPTPYYAPNGFPYRYNPETNTFEEINTKEGN